MDTSSPHEIRFAAVGTGFLIFGWFCYLLSVEGLFFRPLVIAGAILFGVGIGKALFQWLKIPSKEMIVAIMFAVGLAAAAGSMGEPTIFSGRDQGSIANAAIELAHHGTLTFSSKASDTFFSIYGPGKALNFPGFFYTDTGALTTQFPLGYIAWLGGFFSLFGMPGLLIANVTLLSLSLLSIFFFIRYLSGTLFATFGLFLAGSSFLPTWFVKTTLSENLALFLFVFLALNLALFLRDGYKTAFLNTLLASGLLALTRIEGLVILPLALGILYASGHGKTLVQEKPLRYRLFPIASLAIAVLINISVSLPFFRTIAKALYQSGLSLGAEAGALDHAGKAFSLWQIFFLYGLGAVFLLGMLGAAFLASRKKWVALIPFFLAAPSFLYFIVPSITPDHPWMLRRFLPMIWPALLISGILALATIFPKHWSDLRRLPLIRKTVLFFTIAILFAAQLPAFSKYLPFAEGRGLGETIAQIAPLIGENDLLLVDRTVTGDPFALPTGPLASLSGKNTAYFFNPNDYDKLPKASFARVYLLAPTATADAWRSSLGHELVPIEPITFKESGLETLPLTQRHLPEKTQKTQESALFEIRP